MTTVADPDYWSLLGLEPGSDADKLKQAFRREARRWHPDLNGNDPIAEERFKLVNEAYAVLSDPRRRAAWQSGDGPAAEQQQDPFAEGFPGFEDYLDVVLGRVETNQNQRTPTPEPPGHSHQLPRSTNESGFRVWDSGFRVWCLGFKVEGLGFRVCGLGFRI